MDIRSASFVTICSGTACWHFSWWWHISWTLQIHNLGKQFIVVFIPTVLSQYETTISAIFSYFNKQYGTFSSSPAIKEWVLAPFFIAKSTWYKAVQRNMKIHPIWYTLHVYMYSLYFQLCLHGFNVFCIVAWRQKWKHLHYILQEMRH